MAQLTIYLSAETRRRIERAARKAKTSVSKWVTERLEDALSSEWPSGYFELFGSLADERLERPPQPVPGDDARREKL
jgi:hypothetical protein